MGLIENPILTPSKLHNLILYIVSYCGRELGAIELAKMIYLIDLENVRLSGKTMTGDNYTRQERGPLCANFGDCITQMDGFELNVSIENNSSSSFPKHTHTLGKKPRFEPILNQVDLVIIQRVLKRLNGLRPKQLEELAYESEPMRAITDQEKKIGKLLLREKIDFSFVRPNPVLLKWRENMAKEQSPDKDFEAFLLQERKEIKELLVSLG